MIDQIINGLSNALVFPYLGAIIFVAYLVRLIKRDWPFPYTYAVLIMAFLLGVLFYWLQPVQPLNYIYTYLAATSLYELVLKRLFRVYNSGKMRSRYHKKQG